MLSCGGATRPLPGLVKGRVSVVGPCASGKSELVDRLRAQGYDAHHCAQEHSQVPDMWRRLSRPEALVYLDASLEVIRRRRPADCDEGYLQEQRGRLAHAREHCHIYVATDALSPGDVLGLVLVELHRLGIASCISRFA